MPHVQFYYIVVLDEMTLILGICSVLLRKKTNIDLMAKDLQSLVWFII